MRVIESANEDVVIAEFLRGEWQSTRFAGKLKKIVSKLDLAPTLIQRPNVADAGENKWRRLVMAQFRGWGVGKELFEHFPKNVVWHEVELTKKDVSDLYTIDYSYWNEMSGDSRRVSDVAEAVRRGQLVFGVPNNNFLSAAETWATNGIKARIILVGKTLHGPFVVLEGHVRAVGFVLAGNHAPPLIRAYAGVSSKLDRWMKLS